MIVELDKETLNKLYGKCEVLFNRYCASTQLFEYKAVTCDTQTVFAYTGLEYDVDKESCDQIESVLWTSVRILNSFGETIYTYRRSE